MDVKGRVIAILAEQALLQPQDLGPEDTLAGLGIDSLALAETIFAIEEAFDIHVPFNANDPKAGGFAASSVQGVVEAVEGLLAARA